MTKKLLLSLAALLIFVTVSPRLFAQVAPATAGTAERGDAGRRARRTSAVAPAVAPRALRRAAAVPAWRRRSRHLRAGNPTLPPAPALRQAPPPSAQSFFRATIIRHLVRGERENMGR